MCKKAVLTFLYQQRSSEILDELKFESILGSWGTLGWIPEAKMKSYLYRDGYLISRTDSSTASARYFRSALLKSYSGRWVN